MNTVTCTTSEGKTRYYLADASGSPVPEVMDYLKFLDNQGKARNTLRLSCYQLQNYYRFLEEAGKDYRDVTIDDIAWFMAWLRNPNLLKKVVPLQFEPARKEQTINENVDKVICFYDYLVRRGGLENRLSEKLVKFVTHPQRSYKSFLYGIAENRSIRSNILKMPAPQREIRRIKKEEAVALLGECTNIRDYFLLYLLFETGMRIGEALSLWLEDFDLDGLKISVTDRGELENLAEIKTVHSPRKLDCTQDLADLFMGYVCEVHSCDINTNHVFLKLRGENAGKPMDYTDVDNLFRTLRGKTGIQITPHVFHHTSLSLLYADGWAPELLRIRAGHKNIYTTINTYIHPTEAGRQRGENVKTLDEKLEAVQDDPVNHPSHYTSGKIEVIDFIEDQKMPYHLVNACKCKYLCRAGKKDPAKTTEDLRKAVWYINRYIDLLEKEGK